MHLHEETEKEVEGEERIVEAERQDKIKIGGGIYRPGERKMQIFSWELLRQRRKDPSSSWLPNFNLQMSFLSVKWVCGCR